MQDNRWRQGIVSRLEKALPITPGAVPMAGMASQLSYPKGTLGAFLKANNIRA